jgi:bifunctional non-homologous end joining protein LigD
MGLWDGLPQAARSAAHQEVRPEWLEPMLATLTDDRFSDANWIFEPKLDGERCLVLRDGKGSRLLSRNQKVLDCTYPELTEALDRQSSFQLVADGEIVAFDHGLTSFTKLQQRMQLADASRASGRDVAVYLYLFDLLHLAGRDVRGLPLRSRKALLRRALAFPGNVRYLPHRNRDGEALFREACRRGLEGLIAKRADSAYTPRRSRDWLKLKCGHEQELVIGGFTAPKGSRTDFGALLVGYYEDGRLRYAGKVGTGFGRRTLADLGERMRSLGRDSPPFVDVHPIPAGTRWVEPELVAQIGFSEWTQDGRLRHPRYLGLRDDKPAWEVVKEVARR